MSVVQHKLAGADVVPVGCSSFSDRAWGACDARWARGPEGWRRKERNEHTDREHPHRHDCRGQAPRLVPPLERRRRNGDCRRPTVSSAVASVEPFSVADSQTAPGSTARSARPPRRSGARPTARCCHRPAAPDWSRRRRPASRAAPGRGPRRRPRPAPATPAPGGARRPPQAHRGCRRAGQDARLDLAEPERLAGSATTRPLLDRLVVRAHRDLLTLRRWIRQPTAHRTVRRPGQRCVTVLEGSGARQVRLEATASKRNRCACMTPSRTARPAGDRNPRPGPAPDDACCRGRGHVDQRVADDGVRAEPTCLLGLETQSVALVPEQRLRLVAHGSASARGRRGSYPARRCCIEALIDAGIARVSGPGSVGVKKAITPALPHLLERLLELRLHLGVTAAAGGSPCSAAWPWPASTSGCRHRARGAPSPGAGSRSNSGSGSHSEFVSQRHDTPSASDGHSSPATMGAVVGAAWKALPSGLVTASALMNIPTPTMAWAMSSGERRLEGDDDRRPPRRAKT